MVERQSVRKYAASLSMKNEIPPPLREVVHGHVQEIKKKRRIKEGSSESYGRGTENASFLHQVCSDMQRNPSVNP